MKKILASAVLVLALAAPVMAANTIDLSTNNFLRVVLDGATDFEWATATVTDGPYAGRTLTSIFPNGLPLTDVNVYSATTGTLIIIRDVSTTGRIIPPKIKVVDGSSLAKYFTGKIFFKPSILNSEQTTPTNAEIGFIFK